MTKRAPELEHGCGSWVLTDHDGRMFETFSRENADQAAADGWVVKTAMQHLSDLNERIKEEGATK